MKHLKWLKRRLNWSANRLVNYPDICKKQPKAKALRIVEKALQLEGRFGLQKELRNRAEAILEQYASGENEVIQPIPIEEAFRDIDPEPQLQPQSTPAMAA